MSITSSLSLGLLGAALVMLHGTAAAGPEHLGPLRTIRPWVRCDGAIQHPLRVKATALDPVRRGETIRVRVTTASRNALERGEVKLVSGGGAALEGPSRAPFGPLAPGGEATCDFAIKLPAQGKRFLLQFLVTGEGRGGLDSRGATLNLLPDGPADAGRVVTSSTGERIVEYRARRIDR